MYIDYYNFKTLPYSTIEDARWALPNFTHFKEVKIEYNDNFNKTYGRAIEAVCLAKFALTLENNEKEFLSSFQIDYITKVFWYPTTWEFSYKNTEFKYIIKSGTQMGGWGNEFETRSNTIVRISHVLRSQLIDLMKEIQNKWPEQRQKELFEHIICIAKSGKYNH